MYHAACKVEFQPFTVLLTADVFQFFIKLFNNYTSIRSGENNRRQLALSSAIPQGKHNQPCIVYGVVLQVRAYCAQYNIRQTTTNSSTIGKEKDPLSSAISHGTHNQPWYMALQVRMDVLGPVYK